MIQETIKIRGHHLDNYLIFCTHYKGDPSKVGALIEAERELHGNVSTDRDWQIYSAISQADPSVRIFVVDEPDYLCEKCLGVRTLECNPNGQTLKRMDRESVCISRLGLEIGKSYSAEELIRIFCRGT